MKHLIMGFCLLALVGCNNTPHPPTQKPTTNIEAVVGVPPLVPPPAKPTNVDRLDVLRKYRDTLVAYHAYLTGYVNYVSQSNGLIPPFDSSNDCNTPIPLIDIALPPIPKISGLDDTDVIDLLIDHIELLRSKVSDHNRVLSQIREKLASECAT